MKEENQEETLLSLEKLDRESPELWPEKIPGITDFIAMSETPIRTPAPEWTHGLSKEDIAAMMQLSTLQPHALILEIKRMYDEAYQLGVSEAKEMTRVSLVMVEDSGNCLRQNVVGGSASLANLSNLTNVKGKYVWNDRELLMHLQNYTPLILLIDFVEKTRTKRFYESSERYEILMLVFIMRKGSPFCENRRFPEEYWVNLSIGPIADAFDRLLAAIDIPDFNLPIHMSVSDLTAWKQMFDAAMAEIRRFTYYTDPQQLADIGVYNRITFEERFKMQWKE